MIRSIMFRCAASTVRNSVVNYQIDVTLWGRCGGGLQCSTFLLHHQSIPTLQVVEQLLVPVTL
jgi:hypothetical protein